MNIIQNTIKAAMPAKHRNATKGWVSFNAPCCIYNGESRDTKNRGGFNFGADGSIVYHCFNCGFTAGWSPGHHYNSKMTKLSQWLGLDEEAIGFLKLEALRGLDITLEGSYVERPDINFEHMDLPENAPVAELLAMGIQNENTDFADVVSYIWQRGFTIEQFDWRWSPTPGWSRRLLIPYVYHNVEVGYAGRHIDKSGRTKYIQRVNSDFVFGLDYQPWENEIVIVSEGILDAIAIGGVSVLTNEISANKSMLINTLGKEVIVVPDKDKAGQTLIDYALRYDWAVSFPEWEDDIKDIADAVRRYGKLYTLRSILAGKQRSKLKIELFRKKYGTFVPA